MDLKDQADPVGGEAESQPKEDGAGDFQARPQSR